MNNCTPQLTRPYGTYDPHCGICTSLGNLLPTLWYLHVLTEPTTHVVVSARPYGTYDPHCGICTSLGNLLPTLWYLHVLTEPTTHVVVSARP
ncbi:hypothetical protein DPMN_008440 [Dreissena polymorpha]|uniref:Uncharacterized protein n=1 Tax=Dreissena polymorpha TaxID=45954 RepID=A0A9D4RZ57_DREPO|nr:hypothetical protein DPMN_008440 [Dreissena polymorpha]